MLYNQFHALAKQYGAIYNPYGNTVEELGEFTKVLPECDNFYVSQIHSAFNNDGSVAYQLFEQVPVFDELINFLEQVCPHITALQKLQDLIECSVEKEDIAGCTKYYLNSYISIEIIYMFLQKYKYC
jgi:hypothetical protein